MRLQGIKKGFTLIELLVVITIIGILAVGGVSVFTTQLQGARDSTRINDMKLMETAIHQYFNDYTVYPPNTTFSGAIKSFVSKELKDPKKGNNICWDEGSGTPTNNIECGGYYIRTDDSFGLESSAFKLAVAFEKQVNMKTKSTATYDGGNNPSLLEVFAGAGADTLEVGAGGGTATNDQELSEGATANISTKVY